LVITSQDICIRCCIYYCVQHWKYYCTH